MKEQDFCHTYVISTVGTSLLTNNAPQEIMQVLRETANLREEEYEPKQRQELQARVSDVKQRLQNALQDEVAKMSAELNGVVSLKAIGREFTHYLLHTDTYQGELAACMVEEWLKGNGCRNVIRQKLDGMSTRDQSSFSRGVHNLLDWCHRTLPNLREQKGRIVFNLVGGFKSLQAYAQTIGMVYADEICYIFEGPSSELIRIPKLPVKFDTEAMEKHAALITRLAVMNEVVPQEEVADLPEAYLEVSGGLAVLSHWGKLAWNAEKRNILGKRLVDQPGLAFEKSFEHDFEKCMDKEARVLLQEVLAKVCVLWQKGGLQALRDNGGLQYEGYKKHPGIGHFRIDGGRRVSCRVDGAKLCLRRYGSHDDVNNNP